MDSRIEKDLTKAKIRYLLMRKTMHELELSLRVVELDELNHHWTGDALNALRSMDYQNDELAEQLRMLMVTQLQVKADTDANED